jgi:hypothetical protein
MSKHTHSGVGSIGSRRRQLSVVHPSPSPAFSRFYPLVLGAIAAISGIVAIPLVLDARTPRVAASLFIDTSASNQSAGSEVEHLCRGFIEHLKDNDDFAFGQFADRVSVSRSPYDSRDRLRWQQECKQAVQPPPGVGKEKGTDLLGALQRAQLESHHQTISGTPLYRSVIFAINAAEPVSEAGELDVEGVRQIVSEFVKDNGGSVAIVGSEVLLQSQLAEALKDIPNTRLCTFAQAHICAIDWVFSQGRKQ